MASTATEQGASNLGARRNKPAKPIPRLPLSAFSPPNSGTGEKFPLPPSPATVHPEAVYDASARISSIDALNGYSSTLGNALSSRLKGVVVSIPEDAVNSVDSLIGSSTVPVQAISVPLSSLSSVSTSTSAKIVSNTTFVQSAPSFAQEVKTGLAKGVVEISVQNDLTTDAGWEMLEESLTSIVQGQDPEATKPSVVLSNILPPPGALEMPTVTLLNHPSYQAYQAHIATISFFESVSILFAPPKWGELPSNTDTAAANEWNKRIKMYLGPIVEAFGFNRIIFATSNPANPSSNLNPGSWYELARESVAELGIDQEGVDAIFGGNAKTLYGIS
ncbi:hypothetical protein CPB86DRAFT_711581 [Serendipita vermifera]|nr:hypothetical protein CPB86DRAFT_711581 [Serendipita vermifera]